MRVRFAPLALLAAALLPLGLACSPGVPAPAAQPTTVPAAAQPSGAPSAAAPAADSTAASSAAPAPVTLRVGVLPVTGNLDLYVAREKGWFEEEGIALEMQVMAGGAEVIPAIIGGALDIGTHNVFSHILARDQGFTTRAVAGAQVQRRGEPINALMVRPDSPIQTARDLEGKTIASPTLNNIDQLMMLTWLQNQGANPQRATFVEVPFPQMPAALSQGRVDAVGVIEPFLTVAESQGARIIGYHFTDTNEVTLHGYYGATEEWLARNADVARRFARVSNRANEFLTAQPDERRAATVKHLNMSPDIAARARTTTFEARVDPAWIQWWIDAGRRFNLVNNPQDPADYLFETVR